MKATAFLVIAALCAVSEARVFGRCELAYELRAQNPTLFSMELISDWVCLVEGESSRNTAAVGGPNSNGSYDYGLFQINDGYWCGTSGPGKDCNIACSALITDDITDDCKCVDLIYKRHGFSAWHAWERNCEGQAIPDITQECF